MEENIYEPISYNYPMMEQSYIENIIKMNIGKHARIYTSYADANVWKDRVFRGLIEECGRDHIVLRNQQSGEWYLILMVYVNFFEFDEKINYIN